MASLGSLAQKMRTILNQILSQFLAQKLKQHWQQNQKILAAKSRNPGQKQPKSVHVLRSFSGLKTELRKLFIF